MHQARAPFVLSRKTALHSTCVMLCAEEGILAEYAMMSSEGSICMCYRLGHF